MEQFDLSKGIKKYAKEARVVIPLLSLSIVATFVCFALLLLFWILQNNLSIVVGLMCFFAILSVVLFVRYTKNSQNYYFYSFVDLFPDMDAPLNTLACEAHYGKFLTKAQELGFLETESNFARIKQVYSLNVRTKTKGGVRLTAVFDETGATLYNLDDPRMVRVEYSQILTDNPTGSKLVEQCLLFLESWGEAFLEKTSD